MYICMCILIKNGLRDRQRLFTPVQDLRCLLEHETSKKFFHVSNLGFVRNAQTAFVVVQRRLIFHVVQICLKGFQTLVCILTPSRKLRTKKYG